MSRLLEHDYIGLSETSSMQRNSDKISSFSSSTVCTEEDNNNVLNLKETELRLGLPGSNSTGRKGCGVSMFGNDLEDKANGYTYTVSPLKNFVSGSKRGFSDAINGSGKWVLSMNFGSKVDAAQGAALFSPRSGNACLEKNNNQKSCLPAKDIVSAPPPPKPVEGKKTSTNEHGSAPAKAQVVGWPPIRSFRKNTIATNLSQNSELVEGNSASGCLYVKVSMDGAPYLRKVDLKTYCNYAELSSALEKMFSDFTIGQCESNGLPGREGLSESRLMDLLHGSEYVLTCEDKDGDWMLVGDVPWEMFTESCRRLRIMKGSEAIGLAPRTVVKCKNQN